MPDETNATAATADNGTAAVQQTTQETQRTYSQADYDAAMSAQYNKALQATLKKLGVKATDAKDIDAQLAALKAYSDERLTAAEKAEAQRKGLEAERDTARTEAEAHRRELAVIKAGIPPDRAADYTRLAMAYMGDGADFDAALKQALKAFPIEKPPTVKAVDKTNVPPETVTAGKTMPTFF